MNYFIPKLNSVDIQFALLFNSREVCEYMLMLVYMYMSVTVCTSLPQSNEQVTFINIHHVSLVRSVYTIFCIWRTFLKLSAISLSANIQGYIIINNYFVYYANMCSLTFSDANRVILQVICIYV